MPSRLNVTDERIEMARQYFVERRTTKSIAEDFDVHYQVVSIIVCDPKFRRIIRERYNVATT